MRIDVDAGGYHSAAGALVGSNRTVAYSYSVLTSRLGGFGGMGGDDRSSEDFVAAYDDAAVEVCAGIADLTTALGNLGILSAASGENHRAANAGSAYRQPARASSPVDREQPTKVSAYRPPSSLGGDPYGMPEFWDLIVDHLQGWTWPSADVSRLRQASSAWRSMAGALDRAPAQIREARAHLDTQRSPEIGIARAALFEVSQAADDLADECRSIADSCEEYATKVETTRETVKDLLRDLAIEIGATAVIGGIASAATFGGAALVGGGFAAGRASSCAAKIITTIQSLKAISSVSVMSRTLATTRAVRSRLRRFQNARAVRRASRVPGSARRHLWTSWQDYPKVTRNGREYAVVGDRLYARHAIDRLQPSGLGAPAGAVGSGRSVAPRFIDDILSSVTGEPVVRNGVTRMSYRSGSVQVITEDDIVITVITR